MKKNIFGGYFKKERNEGKKKRKGDLGDPEFPNSRDVL